VLEELATYNCFLSRLSPHATEDGIRQALAQAQIRPEDVASVTVARDRVSGQPRGFGFLALASEQVSSCSALPNRSRTSAPRAGARLPVRHCQSRLRAGGALRARPSARDTTAPSHRASRCLCSAARTGQHCTSATFQWTCRKTSCDARSSRPAARAAACCRSRASKVPCLLAPRGPDWLMIDHAGGFGFAKFENTQQAEAALRALKPLVLRSAALKVNFAKEDESARPAAAPEACRCRAMPCHAMHSRACSCQAAGMRAATDALCAQSAAGHL
jgi:hypothetical protein